MATTAPGSGGSGGQAGGPDASVMDEERLPPVDAEVQQSALAERQQGVADVERPQSALAERQQGVADVERQQSTLAAPAGGSAAAQRAGAVGSAMSPSAQRELERARRAETARVAALVQYMLHGRGDDAS